MHVQISVEQVGRKRHRDTGRAARSVEPQAASGSSAGTRPASGTILRGTARCGARDTQLTVGEKVRQLDARHRLRRRMLERLSRPHQTAAPASSRCRCPQHVRGVDHRDGARSDSTRPCRRICGLQADVGQQMPISTPRASAARGASAGPAPRSERRPARRSARTELIEQRRAIGSRGDSDRLSQRLHRAA